MLEACLPTTSADVREQVRTKPRLGLAGYAQVGALFAVSVVTGIAIAAGFGGAVGMSMHAIMGFLLCSLALQRLVDLRTFADAFRRYDLLAMQWRGYGFAYPFLQLALGLGYFSFFAPVQVYFATALLFTFSIAGALSSIHRRGMQHPRGDVSLRVPTNAFAVVEAAVPLAMALVMLWM
jgi:hypothetical protein